MAAAARLADTVLLCYRAGDVSSLTSVAEKVILLPVHTNLFPIIIQVSSASSTTKSWRPCGARGLPGGQQGAPGQHVAGPGLGPRHGQRSDARRDRGLLLRQVRHGGVPGERNYQ